MGKFKFKKGDIVVRTKSASEFKGYYQRHKGAIFACTEDDNRAHYEDGYSVKGSHTRPATEAEKSWYRTGGTNIEMMPKCVDVYPIF